MLVDNASMDSCWYIQSHYPQVRIVRNKQNLGFAQATTSGRTEASTSYSLNNDMWIDPEFVTDLLRPYRVLLMSLVRVLRFSIGMELGLILLDRPVTCRVCLPRRNGQTTPNQFPVVSPVCLWWCDDD